jgi:Protein of unknown function (DUF3987)
VVRGGQRSDGLTDESEWPERRPFTAPALPSPPLEHMPDRLRHFVLEVARVTETNPAMILMLALAVMSGAIARADVARLGHIETANIWGMVLARSGGLKSAIVAQVRVPIDAVAHLFATDATRKRKLADAQADHVAAQARVTRAESSLKKPDDSKGPRDRQSQRNELAAANLALTELGSYPMTVQLVVSDVTPEQLGRRLASNGVNGIGEIAVLLDDESSLDAIVGWRTESSTANVLKTFGGNPISDDRVGREGTTVKSPRLAQAIAVQPIVFAELLADDGLSQKGFVSRYAVIVDVPPPPQPEGIPTPDKFDPAEMVPWVNHVTAVASPPR